MNKTILVIEDDPAIVRLLKVALKTNDYKVITAENGINGISLFLSLKPDLILLDLGLPDMDGTEVLAQIREIDQVPVIIVSARGREKEKVEALDSGADDYITKPFNVGELMARMRVCFRKSKRDTASQCFCYKGLSVDFNKYKVTLDGHDIHLTPNEFKILKLFIENQGKVLTHRYIQKQIWGYTSEDEYQSLRVYITTLRRKIEKNPSSPQYIFTEVGIGYRFSDE